MQPYAIAIHGGAGTLTREEMTPEKEAAYRNGLRQAIEAGIHILEKQGSALDAVEAAVRVLEDHPLFNAGKGAAFSHDGTHELDAAIMDGHTREAGAVAGVKGIKNPVSLARLVMEKSDHVLLAREGAEEFARRMKIEPVPEAYFYTQERYDQLQKKKEQGGAPSENLKSQKGARFGTVGAVALDNDGHLAVATSTGGLTNKRFGRVGDSPLVGAGTYANDRVAVSCTGDGEFFIRTVAAYDLASLLEYKGLELEEAGRVVIHEKLKELGGEGGLVAVDSRGNITLPFNSEGMYRAWQRQGEPLRVSIY
jgi:beta-aspartyl-peptidase (threonine type)